jgi:hypothetical protein
VYLNDFKHNFVTHNLILIQLKNKISMKNISIIVLLVSISQFIYGQTPTLIFTVEKGIDNQKEIIAVPFVMYTNGTYKAIPVCELGSVESKAVKECKMAKETILPIVKPGKSLYVLNNGVQTGIINIVNSTQYGFSDWQVYSATISMHPNVKLLTNNSLLGKKALQEIKSKPSLKKRKSPNFCFFEDKLLSKVDIDGDNIAELIYLSYDYEGQYYQIFSFKNNQWKKVFEGGYQGY